MIAGLREHHRALGDVERASHAAGEDVVHLVRLEGVGDLVEDVHHRRATARFLTRLRQRAADAYVRLDARQQLPHPERFGDEVGRAEAQSAHGRFLGRHGRHHEDRQVAIPLVLLQALEQLQPIHLGHHDVEQQDGGLELFELGEQPVASGADRHLVPIFFQDPGQGLDQRRVVVSDQDSRCGARHQSVASRSERSTLPPLTTSTVVLERGTTPARSAAVVAAPDGSTASRQVRHRNCTAARMLSSSTSTTPRRRSPARASSAKGTSPTLSVISPSAMLPVRSRRTTFPAASEWCSLGAPAGSTPHTTARLPAAASPATMPEIRPPPPTGTTTVSTSGSCSTISSATVAWPATMSG